MNVIDLVAIIPFYLNILLEGLEDFEIIGIYNMLNCKLYVMEALESVMCDA